MVCGTKNKTDREIILDKNIVQKIEFATQTLDRNIGFINSCDTKTSIILTAICAIMTIILTSDGIKAIYSIIKNAVEQKSFYSSLYLITLAVATFMLLFGVFNLVCVIIGRLDNKALASNSYESAIFFSGIIKKESFKAYKRQFKDMTEENFLDDLIAQIYVNAKIASTKYEKYNCGVKFTILGFVLFVIMVLFGIYIY